MKATKTVEQPWYKRQSSTLGMFFEGVFKLTIVYVVSLVAYGCLLFLINFFWLTYAETMVGRRFMQLQGGGVPQLMTFLASVDVLSFALQVNTTALVVAVLIASVSQFLHLKYFFYDHAGFVFRMVFWGGLSTLATAHLLSTHLTLHFVDVIKVAVLPCLFFLTTSFDLASRAIPSIVTLFMLARR